MDPLTLNLSSSGTLTLSSSALTLNLSSSGTLEGNLKGTRFSALSTLRRRKDSDSTARAQVVSGALGILLIFG